MEKIILEALNGDKNSQKELLEICKKETLPITLQYLKRANDVGISFEDLRSLNINAYLKALSTFDETRGTFINYYKYLYMMIVRDEIRKKAIALNKNYSAILLDNFDQCYEIQFNSPSYNENNPKYSYYDHEVLIRTITENRVKLTKKEKEIVLMFLDDYTIKEIADMLKRNYTETYRTLKRAFNKLKDYLNPLC